MASDCIYFLSAIKGTPATFIIPVKKSDQPLLHWHLALELWLQSKDVYVEYNKLTP